MRNKVLENTVPVFSFLFVLAVFALLFSYNGIYPFGDLTIGWGDMRQQTIPLLCEFKDILEGKENFWLSLKNAGGMNFFGIYFFHLSSPFSYLVLFFDKADMPLAVNIMTVLKLALSGCTFAVFLNYEIRGGSVFIVLPLSIFYAFSGYAMMYYQITSWLDIYYMFPLLLTGLEMMRRGRSGFLYTLSLFLCVLFHFYLSYAAVVFVCLYAFLHFILKKDVAFCRKFIMGSVIAALLSAFVTVPCFMQYTRSMRTGNILESLNSGPFFPRFSTALPTFFSVLMLAPFIATYSKGEKDRDDLGFYGILFAASAVPLFLEPVAKAWQTFNYMSFPTRYGFVPLALGFLLAGKGMQRLLDGYGRNVEHNKSGENPADLKCTDADKKRRESRRRVIKTAVIVLVNVFILAFVFSFAKFSGRYYLAGKKTLSAYSQTLWGDEESLAGLSRYYLILLLFISFLWLFTRFRLVKKAVLYIAIGVLCVTEAFFAGSVYMVSPSNDYTGFKRACELEDLIKDGDFYRVNMDQKYFDVNILGAMGYNTTAHFTSLSRRDFMHSMKELGYSSYWMEVNSCGGTVFTDALLRNRYTVHQGRSAKAEYNTGNFYITENDVLFPAAFVISSDGENSADEKLERMEIQDRLFTRLTGKKGLYAKYGYTNLNGVNDKSEDGIFRFDKEGGGNVHRIEYEINIEGEKTLYFDCFNLYRNRLEEPTNHSLSRIYVKKAGTAVTYSSDYPVRHKNGALFLGTYSDCKITVAADLEKNIEARSFGPFSVDNGLLKSSINEVKSGSFIFRGGSLEGNITAEEGGLLFTSLPYDEGYFAKVNGKKAGVLSVGGFTAVKLEKGENRVKVGFFPEGLRTGLVLFVSGALLTLFYLFYFSDGKKYRGMAFDGITDTICCIGVLALGALVVFAVYIMPLAVYFL